MEQRTKQPRHAGVRDMRWRTDAHIFRQGTRPSREETRAPPVFPNAALSGRRGREQPRMPVSMIHDILAEGIRDKRESNAAKKERMTGETGAGVARKDATNARAGAPELQAREILRKGLIVEVLESVDLP